MAATAMVGGTDNNQHKISSKDTMAVATAMETAAVGAAMTARGRAKYLPPLLEEAHAPHSQSEAEEDEAMMGGLWVLAVMVVWGVVHAGCVCAASPCCFVRLTCISAPKKWQTTAY
jgi:hypothetical protein